VHWHLSTGIICLLVAVGMVLIGRPKRDGVSPAFMRHPAAFALYPVTAVTFFAYGVAALVWTYLAIGHSP
jgi:hypothetical protein